MCSVFTAARTDMSACKKRLHALSKYPRLVRVISWAASRLAACMKYSCAASPRTCSPCACQDPVTGLVASSMACLEHVTDAMHDYCCRWLHLHAEHKEQACVVFRADSRAPRHCDLSIAAVIMPLMRHAQACMHEEGWLSHTTCLVRGQTTKNLMEPEREESTASDFLLRSANQRLQRALQGLDQACVAVWGASSDHSCFCCCAIVVGYQCFRRGGGQGQRQEVF